MLRISGLYESVPVEFGLNNLICKFCSAILSRGLTLLQNIEYWDLQLYIVYYPKSLEFYEIVLAQVSYQSFRKLLQAFYQTHRILDHVSNSYDN